MKRRTFLRQAAALSAVAGFPAIARAAVPAGDPFAPVPGPWRSYELVTTIELTGAANRPAKAWVPVPAFADATWIRPGETRWTTNAASAALRRTSRWGTEMLALEWAASSTDPRVELRSRVATRDRSTDFARTANVTPLSGAERSLYTSATALLPTDGIVRTTADRITAGASSDVDKARRIYEWIVANTFRDPKTPGCGIGNIKSMLITGDLGGKCADINALYVGLARAAGLPARDLYGIRVAPSRFGYASLGANTPNVTHAQHCRAEVYLDEHGWVPVDPADVRKVVLEEPPGHLALDDPKVVDARETLFGAWETNWVAYNDGHDVPLPGAADGPVGFLMYPQAEIAGDRIDCLAPEQFTYTITARALT